MKIVDEKAFEFEFRCRGCRSKLIAEIDDVKYGDFGDYDTSSYQYYVVCPVCDTERTLKYHETTPKVRAAAERKKKR